MGTDKGIAGAGQLRNQRGKTVPDIARCLTFDLSVQCGTRGQHMQPGRSVMPGHSLFQGSRPILPDTSGFQGTIDGYTFCGSFRNARGSTNLL